MRFLRRLITFIIALVIIVFSVLNRHDIAFFWSPDQTAINLPLYLIFFAGIFFGLLAAAYATSWLRLKAFARARTAERRVSSLENEIAALNQEVTEQKASERKLAQTGQHKTDLVIRADSQ